MTEKKNKRNIKSFAILSAIIIAVIAIFVTFIIKFSSYDKTEYEVEVGSILYDNELEYIKVEGEAYLTQRWGGNFYLYENKEGQTYKYKLGKNAVVYKDNDQYMYLYGTGYQILTTGDVNMVNQTPTPILKGSPTKLIKLDDRKYLMVDDTLQSVDDKVLDAKGYLLVNIDKKGNPSFSNNELNFKTINQVTVRGKNFYFDIANEKLIYDSSEIDLKNIIGSTNEYKEQIVENQTEDKKIIDGTEKIRKLESALTAMSQKLTDTSAAANAETDYSEIYTLYDEYLNLVIKSVNNLVTSVGGVQKNTQTLSNYTNTTFYDFSRYIALKSVSSNASSINATYTMFDPSSEYEAAWLQLGEAECNNNIGDGNQRYGLDINNESLSIKNLTPDTTYKVRLCYQVVGEQTVTTKDIVQIKTKSLNYKVNVTKINERQVRNAQNALEKKYTVEYVLEADRSYLFNTAKIVLELQSLDGLVNTSFEQSLTAADIGADGKYYGTIDLIDSANTYQSFSDRNVLKLTEIRFCAYNDSDCENVDKSEFEYVFYR